MSIEVGSRIYIAGHRGMVGSAIWRELQRQGFVDLRGKTHDELDLLNQREVHEYFAAERPDYVFLAAARVGGIHANDRHPADFLYENMLIQANVIHAAWQIGVRKLLFLGSSCIYPKFAPQPLTESSLLTGPLEPTNEWYAIAKISGIKLCQAYRRQHGCDFISAMPTNLYGPNDNYDLNSSHVLPAMIRKFHEAKLRGEGRVTCWGSGRPLREFLHVDDLARACVFLMGNYSEEEFVNVGFGTDVSIKELADLVARIVGFSGEIHWDTEKPDGTPRKLMDSSKIQALGWRPQVSLEDGIRSTYSDYLKNCA